LTALGGDPLYRQRGLWLAALGGGAAWFIDLVARYFLVEAGWGHARPFAVAAVGAVALSAAALAAVSCFHRRRRLASENEASPALFVARCGAGLNLLFALLIAATLAQQAIVPAGLP
jgi:hypothetical protein